MANYQGLPVYRAAYALLVQLYAMSTRMSREYKYTLGERIKNDVTELLIYIYKANRTRQKKAILLQAKERIELIRIYIRILYDIKQISVGQQVDINIKIENISKQIHAWYKSQA